MSLQPHFDGNLSSPDHVHEEIIPSRPRTRSQTKRMALILEEEEVGTNGFTRIQLTQQPKGDNIKGKQVKMDT